MDTHRGLDVVAAMVIGGDLQGSVFITYGIVVVDDPIRLDAQNVVEIADERHEGRTRTTEMETVEIGIDISFNRGLTIFNNSGGRGERTVEFEVQ